MSLLGQAALAMWWDIAPEVRADFENWHAHEHFPERMAIAGFRRGTRWSDAHGGEGMFVMYELDDHAVLSSPAYAARLNAPTPWSTRLMPHHRHMVRSQCRVLASSGGGTARYAWTLRISPAAGRDEELHAFIGLLIASLANRPGLTGAHLMKHETPALAATTEQKIRNGADQVADWVFVTCGYSLGALEQLAASDMSEANLAAHGASSGSVSAFYTVAYSVTPADMR